GRGLAAGEATLPWMERQVQRALSPIPDVAIAQLIRNLNDPDSRVRQQATEELKKLRSQLRPILVRTLRETTSAEVRHRLRRILRPLAETPRFTNADLLRFRR